jgi:K+-transporting ATPase ATPase C chain
MNDTPRTLVTALRLLLVLTVILGVGYPLLVTGVGQAFFAAKANGSIVSAHGRPAGSSLIGQSFDTAAGRPDPRWFQPRPSAAGYDPRASGASNLGPDSARLTHTVERRRAAVAAFDGVPAASVPPDAVTASGSGLDPDISVAYAREQVHRVATARHLPVATVARLVARCTEHRSLGFLGEPGVNVVLLNRALAERG